MANGRRLAFKGEPIKVQLPRAMQANELAMATAIHGAAQDVATEILTKGRADIEKAGNFGSRWTQGLSADVEPKGGPSLNATVTVAHTVPYFSVFQEGETIRGSPLLWIPFSYTGIKIRARDYARTFGGLFYTQNKAGLPMLFSLRDRKPKFFGVSAVTLKKRFHVLEIGEEAARQAQTFYANRLGK